MTTKARTAARLAAAGAVALLLAACGDDPAPIALPTVTSNPSMASPVATATTVPVPTPVPSPVARVTDPSPDGAIAAAVYFSELYGYAVSTGDLAAWRDVSDPECSYCKVVAEDVEAGGDYRFEGGQTRVLEASLVGVNSAQDHLVHLIIEQDAWTSTGVDGSSKSGERTSINADALLHHNGSQWIVLEYDAVNSAA
ncbi:DUF6318 family protein [Cellulomonas endophytica]|uniref:DUF6318 family protein n=1 Tax=Cellulomonas endophytica TaxID=2494735 RepID=UPI001011FDA3|nr:DUF6318 family protein [Cellulomonas endophytica]